MTTWRRSGWAWLLVGGLLVLGLGASAGQSAGPIASSGRASPQGWWDDRFHRSGVQLDFGQGSVDTIVADGTGALYIGGNFTSVNGVAANRVARWDGSQWYPLGGGVTGASGHVNALALSADGELYVGGSFDSAGGVATNAIARWDGTSWHAVGGGMVSGSEVHALAFDAGGALLVGGDFTTLGTLGVSRIARWDGSAWQPLEYGVNDTVRALMVDESGALYAAGDFTIAGRLPANRIARWDGLSWSPLGSGLNNTVHTLTADEQGNLYVGGAFSTAGGSHAPSLARWDGHAWSALSSSMGVVRALDWGEDGLYVGGSFTSIDGNPDLRYLSLWDGAGWRALGGIPNDTVTALLSTLDRVYVGGEFALLWGGEEDGDNVAAPGLAAWDGSRWRLPGARGQGIHAHSWVRDLATDGASNLYAVGDFVVAGNTVAQGVARWDGTQWYPLGDEALYAHSPNAVATGPGGAVYVGTAQGTIFKLKGTSWVPIGVADAQINVMLTDPTGENLYVGGWFSSIDGENMFRVARWDGSGWRPLGPGLYGGVYALALDGVGRLYVGGDFQTPDGLVDLALWDGASWSAVGGGTDGSVQSLAIAPDGALYVGGDFLQVGSVAANSIALWNGIKWLPLGAGVTGGWRSSTVQALQVLPDGGVVAAGRFSQAGSASASLIAYWTGTTWLPLGEGLRGQVAIAQPFVSSLALIGSSLYVGGNFTRAGEHESFTIARWYPAAPPPTPTATPTGTPSPSATPATPPGSPALYLPLMVR